MSKNYPIVLSFSGHDPSGGAGIQADIETLASHHCHGINVITVLTEQDSINVKKIIPQSPENIIAQAQRLLADMPVKVIKIGLIGDEKIAEAIASILIEIPEIPVILDPVLVAGGGKKMGNQTLIQSMIQYLLPYTHILTPNLQEARLLTGLEKIEDCATFLQEKGCEYVLITGADEHQASKTVKNYLFAPSSCKEIYHWERLPYSYHGSGCTLASSLAGLIAHDLEPVTAVMEAQTYTWNSLKAAYQSGQGQHHPNRLFWLETEK